MSNDCLKSVAVGTGEAARPIAVRQRPGGAPGLFWLGGFKSDMQGTKVQALDAWAQQQGRALTRFDYSGHGQSGGSCVDGTSGCCLAGSLVVLETCCFCSQVLVGSRMLRSLPSLLFSELARRAA